MNKLIKKYINYGLSICLIVSMTGCKDYFDVGNNPNLVTSPNINSLLTTVTSKSGINSRTFASFSSYYAQHLASPGAGSDTDTYRITDLSGTWNAVYYAMADIEDMLIMAEATNAHYHAGIAKILMAYNLSLVADCWDSAPYSEAFFTKVQTFTPAYDSGESLYQTIGTLLQEGIVLLGRTDNAVTLTPAADLIHGGNINTWIKTGYGLLARHQNKITKKSNYNPNAVLTSIDNSYTSAADDMMMGVFNGNNPWAAVAISNAGSLLGGWLSNQLVDHLNGVTYGIIDPRLYKITDATVHGDYVGTRNGQGNVGAANTIKDECYISINSPVTRTTSPIYIMTYEELKFVEAEAAHRANQPGRAYDAYIEGIKASMKKLEVAEADIDAYLAESSVSVGAAALTLDHIFKEKYIATYLNFETWNDARRYDYQYQGFELPFNAALPTFIRQVAVPSREISTNPTNAPSQQPVLSTPLWWDRP